MINVRIPSSPGLRRARQGLVLKMRSHLKNLTLFGVTLAIMLVVGEGLVRWVFQDLTTTGDNTSYFATRWKRHHVSLNSWGFRDREVNVPKPEGIFRIAVIGDSFTFGQGIDERDRFGNLLETKLNNLKKSNLEYEILNFGRPGAQAEHHLAILKEKVLPVNPDFILLQWYINDFEGKTKVAVP